MGTCIYGGTRYLYSRVDSISILLANHSEPDQQPIIYEGEGQILHCQVKLQRL